MISSRTWSTLPTRPPTNVDFPVGAAGSSGSKSTASAARIDSELDASTSAAEGVSGEGLGATWFAGAWFVGVWAAGICGGACDVG